MNRALISALLLGGCDKDPDAGPAEVPFPLANPVSSVFTVSPGSRARDGYALLVLSNGELGCADVHAPSFGGELTESLAAQEGLLFVMFYTDRGDPREADPWSGLWMSDTTVGEDERNLGIYVMHEGFLSRITSGWYGLGGDGWLDMDYSAAQVTGRYATDLWSGSFEAVNCGAWADPVDTGERDTDRWDTDRWDTDVPYYTGPTEVQSATYNCDSAAWWYDVYTVGWTGGAELFISQTGVDISERWSEYGHDFWPTESSEHAPDGDTRGYYDPDGYWDNPYLELAIVQSPGDVVLGDSTLYPCNTPRERTMTWAIEVRDTSGADVGCVTWGQDPSNQDDYNFRACQAI
ncbi:MAG: hypothetical protein H6740_24655 [Alphaproteobacteria bacterium]|nr:hypothetical protein [Alphaproteobacteria bacterium]